MNYGLEFGGCEKTVIQKDPCTPKFIAALFTIAKTWKQYKFPSSDEWIKKMWHIHTMEYHSVIKKCKIMPFAATRMDMEMTILSAVIQKDNYYLILLICRI